MKQSVKDIATGLIGAAILTYIIGWKIIPASCNHKPIKEPAVRVEQKGDSLYYIKNNKVDTVIYSPEDKPERWDWR